MSVSTQCMHLNALIYYAHTHTYLCFSRQENDANVQKENNKLNNVTSSCDTTDFARTMPSEHIGPFIRVLARRSTGHDAILNSPTVIREITKNKRQVARELRSRRDEKLSKSRRAAAQFKGCATKVCKKLIQEQSRNKGL